MTFTLTAFFVLSIPLKMLAYICQHLAVFSVAPYCSLLTCPDALLALAPITTPPLRFWQNSVLHCEEWNLIGSGHLFLPGQRLEVQPMDG